MARTRRRQRAGTPILAGITAAIWLAAAPAGAAADPDLYGFESREYEIETDVDRATIARIGAHMDSIFREYTRRFGDFPVRNATSLKLYVFAEQDDYMSFLDSTGIDATGSGGMFFVTGDAKGLATFIGDRPLAPVLETLRHEGLHQFAYLRIHEDLPQWINEGMGEYYGYAVETRGGIEPGVVDPGALERVREAVENGTAYPLDELLFITNANWNAKIRTGDDRAGLMYDQSWSVVHFLAHADRGRFEPLLTQYLRAAWSGLSPAQASEKVFGDDLATMEQAWEAYVLGLEPDAILAAMDQLRVYANALGLLDEQDVRPKTLDEFKTIADERNYRGQVMTRTGPREVNGDPGAWWLTPPNNRRGRPATVNFKPDRRDKLPASVEIRGLRRPVWLTWSRTRGGELEHTIEVR